MVPLSFGFRLSMGERVKSLKHFSFLYLITYHTLEGVVELVQTLRNLVSTESCMLKSETV